jgi:hypothetical protein
MHINVLNPPFHLLVDILYPILLIYSSYVDRFANKIRIRDASVCISYVNRLSTHLTLSYAFSKSLLKMTPFYFFTMHLMSHGLM